MDSGWTKSRLLSWRLLSFLAADPNEQAKLIGECPAWFVRERTDVGANYLIGVALAASHLVLSDFREQVDDESLLVDLDSRVRSMLEDFGAEVWNSESLATNAEWQACRRIARECIGQLSLLPALPHAPFLICDIVDVEDYGGPF